MLRQLIRFVPVFMFNSTAYVLFDRAQLLRLPVFLVQPRETKRRPSDRDFSTGHLPKWVGRVHQAELYCLNLRKDTDRPRRGPVVPHRDTGRNTGPTPGWDVYIIRS